MSARGCRPIASASPVDVRRAVMDAFVTFIVVSFQRIHDRLHLCSIRGVLTCQKHEVSCHLRREVQVWTCFIDVELSKLRYQKAGRNRIRRRGVGDPDVGEISDDFARHSRWVEEVCNALYSCRRTRPAWGGASGHTSVSLFVEEWVAGIFKGGESIIELVILS